MRSSHILVIDDEISFCRMLETILSDSGYRVTYNTDSLDAAESFKPGDFDLVISDVKMPGLDGLGLLQRLREKDSHIPILMITAYATVDMSIEALRKGAFDMLTKPFEPEELLSRVRNALRQVELLDENLKLRDELAEHEQFGEIVGQSSELLSVLDTARKIARRDISVIITGESGTGKELVARAIHKFSPRGGQKFVAINCGALPGSLLGSELFGHRKGAFTGADRDKKGLLETADKGTLLLDEVGNLPMDVQKTLLRFLQEKEFYRVGESSPTTVDVRILSATNADLISQIERGSFREDLYYRLAVVNLHLPPLRKRRSDIPLLATSFLQEENERFKTQVKGLKPKAMQAFLSYGWPGNVRELKNVIHAALAIENREYIGIDSISRLITVTEADAVNFSDPVQQDYAEALAHFEHTYFQKLMKNVDGNAEAAAQKAGVNLATIYRKIKKYDLRS
jgi:DNA-binding NtrC family response regulator